MISNAKAKFQRISPRKARMVVNLIRGRDASEALQLLEFTPKAGAPFVRKVLASRDLAPRLHAIERYGSHTDDGCQGSG